MTWAEEIREIVRDGIYRAHPWLALKVEVPPWDHLHWTAGYPLGIPVIVNDLLAPGTFVIGDFSRSFHDVGLGMDFFPKPTWREEIRNIVYDGLAAAFPDLVMPTRWRDPGPLLSWRFEEQLALSVLNPRSIVTGTGVC